MSNAWYLAPSLTLLRAEVNRRWPDRDRKSDGTIGDAAHSARVSDHNPNARRSVNALDVDRDGIDPMVLVNVAISDARTNYVIFNRTIWSRSRGFKARAYTGSNPHIGHVHISIRQAKSAEQDTRPWGIDAATSTKPGLPSSGVNPTTGGLSMSDVKTIMAKLERLEALALSETATHGVPYVSAQARAVAGMISALQGRIDGLTVALTAASSGKPVDLAAVEAAAKRGVEAGLKGASVTVELGG